jgi:hypothetical protein
MQSIMGGEIAYTFRRSDLGINRAAKRDDSFFRFPAISQFSYGADDLLFVRSFSRNTFIPPEDPSVWTTLTVLFKKTSLLKSPHMFSFAFHVTAVRITAA